MITNFLLCYFLCCFLLRLEMAGLEGDGLVPTCLPSLPVSVLGVLELAKIFLSSIPGLTLNSWCNNRISGPRVHPNPLSSLPARRTPTSSPIHTFAQVPALSSLSPCSLDLFLALSLVSPTHQVSGLSFHPLFSCQLA